MKNKKKRKGFTLVELLVVIAILAVLATVAILGYTQFTKKANIANDQAICSQMNLALQSNEALDNKAQYAHQAVGQCQDAGFILENLTPSTANYNFAYDKQHNRFMLLDDKFNFNFGDDKHTEVKKENNYWIYVVVGNEEELEEANNEEHGFSTYLRNDFQFNESNMLKTISTTKGIDVGEYTGVSVINYSNEGESQDVVIRTNGGKLSVYAPNDVVKHYGTANEVTVKAVKDDSYHENGTVAFMEINKGHVVVEATGVVDLMYANPGTYDTTGATFTPDTTVAVKVTNNGDVDHAHVVGSGETGKTNAATVNGVSSGITFDYNNNKEQNTNVDVYHHVAEGDREGIAPTDTKVTTAEFDIETGKTEAINHLVENEEASEERQVLITKDGEASTWMTLAAFRDSVNAGKNYAGYLVSLKTNVDLKGVEWTPIGTAASPFSGKFDGENHTISNMTATMDCKGSETYKFGLGLFGYIHGTQNDSYTDIASIYDSTTHLLNESNLAENLYSCVVKNIIIDYAVLTRTDESGDGNSGLGACVGFVDDGYVANVSVKNSTLTGVRNIGGVVGSSRNDFVIKNCTTDENTVINAKSYHAGGIVGGMNRDSTKSPKRCHDAVIACTNYATINQKVDNTSASIGGIVGFSGSTIGLSNIIYNCNNFGEINATNADKLGGIAGDGQNVQYVVNCTNFANIIRTSENPGTNGFISGITCYTSSAFINCYNYGTLSGYAKCMGGIDGFRASWQEGTYISCENYGTLINNYNSGTTDDICGGTPTKKEVSNDQSIDEINTLLVDEKFYSKYIFSNQEANEGTLNVPSGKSYLYIVSDAKLCSELNIPSDCGAIYIEAPNQTFTINQDLSNVSLYLIGSNNNIIIAGGAKIGTLSISGEDSKATINGNVDKLILSGSSSTSAEIGTSGKVSRVLFSGTGNYTLTNRGLISCTCNDEWGTSHVVTTQSPCTITINNYGTIESKKGEHGKCAYALLFYNGCNVTFNAYSNSSVTCDTSGYVLACWSANSVVFNYQEGATLMNGSAAKAYTTLAGGKVTVNVID